MFLFIYIKELLDRERFDLYSEIQLCSKVLVKFKVFSMLSVCSAVYGQFVLVCSLFSLMFSVKGSTFTGPGASQICYFVGLNPYSKGLFYVKKVCSYVTTSTYQEEII